MKNYEGYKYIEGGVCAAKGYRANGLNCGLNPDKNKNDLCLVAADTDAVCAAVYTTNKVKGAPITVTRAHLEKTGGICRAVIANSKNATRTALKRRKKCAEQLPQHSGLMRTRSLSHRPA